MPRPNKGPRLRFLERRGFYYIVWYECGTERLRSTGTADQADAEAALAVFQATGRLPDMGWTRMQDQEQFVYFVGGENGPIKIGVTNRPQHRLRQMQCGSPTELKLLAVTDGGKRAEYLYHLRFRAHRLHGEWFNRAPEITAEIERLNSEEMAA
jgi:hypothetical protein